MRRIERTNAFLRDFKREKRGHHRRELEMVLTVAVSLLAEDKPPPERNRDHTLGGDWRDHRECHLRNHKPVSERDPVCSPAGHGCGLLQCRDQVRPRSL